MPDGGAPSADGPGWPDMLPMVTCDPPRPVTAIGTNFFTDVSDASGIRVGNFIPDPMPAIPINDHSRLGFADIDGDGYDDIHMHSLYPNVAAGWPFENLVFLNNKDGSYTDFSDASGLRNVQAAFFVFGDVDNDGDADCFAGLDINLDGEGNRIFLNDGQGHFTEKLNAGFDADYGATATANAVFADFNGDAKLDLFLGNGGTSGALIDQLYFGNGDGSFTEVTTQRLTMPRPARPSNGVVSCDYDDDGDLDIFVATYGVSIQKGHNILWENDGQGTFTNVALDRGFAALIGGNYWLATTGNGVDPEPNVTLANAIGSNAFGIDCQDVNGDGLADIYMATISHPVDGDYSRKWSDPSQLLINQGAAGTYAFKNEFLERGLPFNEGDIDAATMDFDNDGLIDLSVTRDNKYEGGYTTVAQKSWFGLMHQNANGTFDSVGVDSGINDPALALVRMKGGQNHAWSDIDHDGDLDLLVGGRDKGGGRPNFLFRNDIGSQNGWMAIRLTGDGVEINRDALGARVTITGGGKVFQRELKSSRGTYDSTDTRVLHFGVGELGCDFQVEVRWPNGKKVTYESINVPRNKYIQIDYVKGLRVL